MKLALLALLALSTVEGLAVGPQDDGFVTIFNGTDLSGWKANENPATFKVENGAIVANGQRSHLFYVGEVGNHVFKNFELKAQVLCKPNSNAGIYFHTEWQDNNWPAKGFEAQICANAYKDPRKTGSLYAIKDLAQSPVKDDEWFEYHIVVNGKKVEIKLDGQTVNEWTQPDDYTPKQFKGRILDKGTFALQGHDPGSTVMWKNIRVKVLPD